MRCPEKAPERIKQVLLDCVAGWQIASTNDHHLCCSPEILFLRGFRLGIVNERSFREIWKVYIKLRSLILRSHESHKAATLTWQFSRPPQRLPLHNHSSWAQPAMGSLFVIVRLTGFSNFLKSFHDSTQARALKQLVTASSCLSSSHILTHASSWFKAFTSTLCFW